jgi:hypothetical protein
MDPRMNPRISAPAIHKIKLSHIGPYKKIEMYDNYSSELLMEIQYYLESNNFILRNGDIIVETDIDHTVFFKDVIRNGITIFNGKKVQYLDRTLNKAGTLPCNFISCSDFKLGYWDKIFNDNIVWLKPTPQYHIEVDSKNEGFYAVTPDYRVYMVNIQATFFYQLMNSEFSILVVKDEKNNLFFNSNLHNVYHKSLNTDLRNLYIKDLFFITTWNTPKPEYQSKSIWKCSYKELYNIKITNIKN